MKGQGLLRQPLSSCEYTEMAEEMPADGSGRLTEMAAEGRQNADSKGCGHIGRWRRKTGRDGDRRQTEIAADMPAELAAKITVEGTAHARDRKDEN